MFLCVNLTQTNRGPHPTAGDDRRCPMAARQPFPARKNHFAWVPTRPRKRNAYNGRSHGHCHHTSGY
jgi:hypothetical protein